MEGKSCTSSKNHNSGDAEESNAIMQLEGEPMLGDITWVKLHGDSWWPAVVFGSNVSGDREIKGVRVRLIGSYEYMYVDPIKCRSEFHITLEKNNGSYEEIFRKALEQDISQSNSSRVKGKVTKSKGEKAISKASKQDGVKRKLKLDSLNPEKNTKRKTSNRDGMQKKLKQKSSSTNERVEKTEEFDSTQKRVKLKRQGGKEKHSPRTAERVKSRSSKEVEDAASPGRSQELSARRTKVMQTLGLIAPSGSPFHQKDRFV
ncbi:uncharacterized protein LOC105630701 isoform X2 [Jatropha curcas]|uniref:uncharacterized protein LOC105630701 isoform X2 n=1 Tax=Jatropha curcas TaxID=180498 RepID=UPI00189427F8|nr:uncharacterized protein LOC105630701 isoform X2 [Jatropha curcas]